MRISDKKPESTIKDDDKQACAEKSDLPLLVNVIGQR